MSAPKPYASGTTVSVEKSKAELDGLLAKHGASSRGIMTEDLEGRALVAFQLGGRHYRLEVPLPRLDAFTYHPTRTRCGYKIKLTAGEQQRFHEQAGRERWRAVVLLVKAKLELVAMGVSSVEREFLADLVLPGGERLHAALNGAIEKAYATGERLLPPASVVAP